MLEMRELERKDLPIINAWRRDAELISRLGAPYRFIGPEIDDVWFDTYLKSRGSSIRCVTFDSEKQQLPLCLVSLTGIDWVARSATLHLMILSD